MTGATRRPIGAILAGGRSRRMGDDKALIELGGKPMLTWVASALQAAGCDPLVVGRSSAPGGVPAVLDDLPGRAGPAAGLVTALRLADERDVFLAATDQPFLRPDTVRALLGREADAVVPVDGGTLQTTCAVYRNGCLAPLRALMADDPSLPLRSLFRAVGTSEIPPAEWRAWGEDGRSWWSLDRPTELEKARSWLREASFGDRSPQRRDET